MGGDGVKGGRRREREVIDCTHAKQVQRMLPEGQLDMPSSIPDMPKLTLEEHAILYAKPTDKSVDRAFVKWGTAGESE